MKLWMRGWKQQLEKIDHLVAVIISDITFSPPNIWIGIAGLHKWMRGMGSYIINQAENANRERLDMIWNLAACLHQRLLTFLLDSAPSLEGSGATEEKKKNN